MQLNSATNNHSLKPNFDSSKQVSRNQTSFSITLPTPNDLEANLTNSSLTTTNQLVFPLSTNNVSRLLVRLPPLLLHRLLSRLPPLPQGEESALRQWAIRRGGGWAPLPVDWAGPPPRQVASSADEAGPRGAEGELLGGSAGGDGGPRPLGVVCG